jgi:hypothetical protein
MAARKPVMRRVSQSVSVAFAAMLAGTSMAAKVSLPKEGTVDVYNCFGGDHQSIVLKDNVMVGAWRLWGATYTIPAGRPFDVAAIYCFGTYSWLVNAETEHGYCDVTDADGDKFIWTYNGKDFVSSGPVVAGTGKYEGMTGMLTSKPVSMYPSTGPTHHHRCHRIEGTYKLK